MNEEGPGLNFPWSNFPMIAKWVNKETLISSHIFEGG